MVMRGCGARRTKLVETYPVRCGRGYSAPRLHRTPRGILSRLPIDARIRDRGRGARRLLHPVQARRQNAGTVSDLSARQPMQARLRAIFRDPLPPGRDGRRASLELAVASWFTALGTATRCPRGRRGEMAVPPPYARGRDAASVRSGAGEGCGVQTSSANISS